jgi:CheY-like chemotaxis protein
MNPKIKLIAYLKEDYGDISETFHLSIYKPLGYQSFIRKIERFYGQRTHSCSKKDYTNLKILLVEDVDINRIYEVEMLKNFFGILCDTAEDGLVALEKVKEKQYDLILMDMRMPVMDGLEATRKIREFNVDIPIVCMSANVYKEDKMAAEEAGMNNFIEKPLERRDIENILLKLLNSQLLSKEEKRDSYQQTAQNFLRENFDEVVVQTLYKTALKSIFKGLNEIEIHSSASLSTKALREDFHKLKGTLLNLGLVELAKQAEVLQHYAEEEDILSLKELQKEFVAILKEFLEESLE